MAPIVAIRASGFNYLQIEVSFTAVTRVQIPSGTPNLFRKLRAIAELFVGTKRHKLERISTGIALQSSMFSRASSTFSQAQKGTAATP